MIDFRKIQIYSNPCFEYKIPDLLLLISNKVLLPLKNELHFLPYIPIFAG